MLFDWREKWLTLGERKEKLAKFWKECQIKRNLLQNSGANEAEIIVTNVTLRVTCLVRDTEITL